MYIDNIIHIYIWDNHPIDFYILVYFSEGLEAPTRAGYFVIDPGAQLANLPAHLAELLKAPFEARVFVVDLSS